MIQQFLKLSKHTVIYGFGQLGSKVVAVILIPLYTSYLTTQDYGVLQLANTYISLFLVLVLLGMNTSMFRVYYKSDNLQERKLIINTTFTAFLLIALCIFTPIMIVLSHFSQILIFSPQSSLILWLIFFTVFFEGIFSLQLAVLRAEERSKTYSLIAIIKVLIYIFITILFVVCLKWNFLGVLTAGILSYIIINIVLIPLTMSKFRFQISKKHLREILGIGIPLTVSGLGAWILNLSDRYMLQFLLPEETAMSQVGIYSLGDKIAMLLRFILVMPFMLTWGAQMYSYAKKTEAKIIYRKVLNAYCYVACIIGFFIALFAREFVLLMAQNSDYYPAYLVVPFLTFSKILTGIILIISVGAVLTDHSKYIAISSLIAAILNVLLNFLFIPRFEMMGAAFGSLIAYSINGILLYYLTQRVYYVQYDKWRILIFGVLILLISIFTNVILIPLGYKILLFLIILIGSPLSKLITYKNFFDTLEYLKLKLKKS
jgi:O-antigen/teichoic acid export membrane protein